MIRDCRKQKESSWDKRHWRLVIRFHLFHDKIIHKMNLWCVGDWISDCGLGSWLNSVNIGNLLFKVILSWSYYKSHIEVPTSLVVILTSELLQILMKHIKLELSWKVKLDFKLKLNLKRNMIKSWNFTYVR